MIVAKRFPKSVPEPEPEPLPPPPEGQAPSEGRCPGVFPKSIPLHLTLSPQSRRLVPPVAINISQRVTPRSFQRHFQSPEDPSAQRLGVLVVTGFSPRSPITAGWVRSVTGGIHSQQREQKKSSGWGWFPPAEQEDTDDLFHSLSKVIMYLGSLKMCISFLWQTRTASLVPV